MPFIDRDDAGAVNGLYSRAQFDGQAFLAEDHPDVSAYRNAPRAPDPLTAEEVYDMLESKGVLSATDRPARPSGPR